MVRIQVHIEQMDIKVGPGSLVLSWLQGWLPRVV